MSETKRRLLPMLGHTNGKRSAVTCALKCGDACAKAVCNTSDNNYFRDIVSAEFSRRSALGVGAAGALTLLISGASGTSGAYAAPGGAGLAPAARIKDTSYKSKLAFTPISPVDAMVDDVTVPEGFDWKPVIRWGDPLFNNSPEFDVNNQTAESQALQFGYNCDYTDILEVPGSKGRRAVMFVNHEYTNEAIMFPPTMPEAVVRATARAAHGLTVVELERKNKNEAWSYIKGAPLNRRFVFDTPYEFTGPAAGSDLLKTVDDPAGRTVRGTLNNCAGGTTPWGTILSGEENFNQYFVTPGTPEDQRYGFSSSPTRRGWEIDEPRLDTRNPGYENESNRFGYIVEVDPFDPASTPKKHTALGRFKHEGAEVIVAADGHVVAYAGDDERFDYVYKFVSKNVMNTAGTPEARRENMNLLSEGSLYVARFQGNSAAEIDGSGSVPSDGAFDGVGEWLPLLIDSESAVPGMSTAEVCVYTRLAADRVGATKMDRPEDVQPNLKTGKIYVACTNNTARGTGTKAPADEANPRKGNRFGHVVEITENGGNQTAVRFTWNLLMVCGDPANNSTAYFSGFPADQVSPISCPDNLAFDSVGNLWISTDGQPGTIGYCDGLFKVTLEGASRGNVEQFLAVPRDGETCGPIIHDEERHVFVAVQHPGEDGEWGAQESFFPDYVPAGTAPAPGMAAVPRPSVVQVFPAKGRSRAKDRS